MRKWDKKMTSRNCPVCETAASSAKLFLEKNIDSEKLSKFSFASRKLPEYMSHHLVQCPKCDLVYADSPPSQSELANAYHVSDFDSTEEAEDAAETYYKAVYDIIQKNNKKYALEIGTGTGIFLEYLKNNGFDNVIGIEPSSAAIAAAPPHRRAWIQESIFRESDFEPNTFNFICCFMTLEHVRDPQEIVSAATRLLAPGGVVAFITHDYRSTINSFLGSKSPIIDIEHMQLFSKKSMYELLTRNKLKNISISSIKNRYTIKYWIRLLPLSNFVKLLLLKILTKTRLGNVKIAINVGNIISYASRED